jgi:hypothetical protein
MTAFEKRRAAADPLNSAHTSGEAIERLRAGETQADIARTYGGDPIAQGRKRCRSGHDLRQTECAEPLRARCWRPNL